MMKQIGVHFVWLCLIVPYFTLYAQDEWELTKQDENIKVYLHKSWKDNGTYKAEAIINAPIQVVYEFLIDFDNYINWVYSCEKIEVLLAEKDEKYAYYAYYSIPWPFSDRDAVSVLEITHHSNGNIEVISKPGIGYKPVVENAIRINEFGEHYEYIPLSANSTRVKMTGNYDPGGKLPDWLIKQFLSMGPFGALKEMKKNSEERVKKQ